ncbi:putative Serine-threonine protein kinase, plant-type [Hibiscus syriacus]|uniref:Serine-threonine protein kinase, plant-type n=1 Tax=Hibiscus syriacus TaxID=106335 RepID=A0A6A2XX83_HIBSY|nr:putative Serine-threonine protein kinase, plant-type [Hibiscus syriacus]
MDCWSGTGQRLHASKMQTVGKEGVTRLAAGEADKYQMFEENKKSPTRCKFGSGWLTGKGEGLLVKTLGKLRDEADSPVSSDSKELQQEIVECKFRIADMQKRLNIFEGEPAEITTLIQAEFHEQFLEETLKQVRLQKQVLQEKYNSFKAPDAADVSGFVTGSTSDWIPQKDPQVQILNFLDSNGLLPQRDQCENILPPQSTTLLDGEETINVCHDMQRPEFEQVIDVNLSPWTQLYPTGICGPAGFL